MRNQRDEPLTKGGQGRDDVDSETCWFLVVLGLVLLVVSIWSAMR